MIARTFIALGTAFAGLTAACSPDTRPWRILKLETYQQGNVTLISFDAARSDDSNSEPIHCTRREEEGVINTTFFSSCSRDGYQWIASDFKSGTPPEFGIFLQLNTVCPPSPEEQSFSWRTGDLSQFMGCKRRGSGTFCEQVTKNIIYATWT